MNKNIGKLFRLIIIVVWVILFGRLLSRDYFIEKLEIRETKVLQRGIEESYMGIYFTNERIGYVKNHLFDNETSGFTLNQEAILNLNILDKTYPVTMNMNAELDDSSLLKNFQFNLYSPFYKLEAEGEVIGNDVHYSMNTGKDETSNIIQLSERPFIPTHMRSYLLKNDLEEGKKFKIPYFDPITMTGKESIIEYKGLEKKLFYRQSQIQELHHFVEKISGLRMSIYLDNKGKVVREVSPTGFVFISEPEFRAKDIISKGTEILSSISIPVLGKLDSVFDLSSIRYRLTIPEETQFELNQDRQQYNENILVINKETIPSFNAKICYGEDEYLSSTPYVQSRHPIIRRLSQAIVKNEENDVNKIRTLINWVYEYLDKKPVLSIPDAMTTLRLKMGDCNEHAALFAALSRSLLIPTRIVAGVTYNDGMFYYHAWNEVCLDGKWISLDTTINQFPADLTHIKFVQGETSEQIRISALIGKLKIEVLEE